ncbi:MAG: prolyl oligopeptidase family serine peptidase [Oligoflexia bacterium]|nr:prolyl oligopeptidase family serine peptidase [Oligoflexia bacterium]
MQRLHSLIVLVLILSFSPNQSQAAKNLPTVCKKFLGALLPYAKRTAVTDNFHGNKVLDPYRWLEGDYRSTPVRKWIRKENEFTQKYLANRPIHKEFKERLTELFNYDSQSAPSKRGDRYFIYKHKALANQSVLYTMKNLGDEPQVLLDPNAYAKDGTVALSGTSLSRNGKLLAYALSTAGSDYVNWGVRDIETGVELPDQIKDIKFSSLSWSADDRGFYYSRFTEKTKSGVLFSSKVFFHILGTPESSDKVVYEDLTDKNWGFGAWEIKSGNYLFVSGSKTTDKKNTIHAKDLRAGANAPFKPLFNAFDAAYHVLKVDGTRIWVSTTKDASKGKIISTEINDTDPSKWKDIIPEPGYGEVIEDISILNNQFVITYLKDSQSVVRVYDLEGKFIRNIELPGLGTVSGFNGEDEDTKTFYTFTSFTSPAVIYRYDMLTNKSEVYFKPNIPADFSNYETKQIFYKSKDGTQVPMFVVHKKDLVLDGTNPTYLYGYGGFNISLTSSFSASVFAWLEKGGVYAMPNLRGGGEYGESWHAQGMLEKKQNVFDDFIAAAHWLIDNKYTSSERLAIGGGSNGGLLVGAVMVQEPDLFKVAIPAVGVLDMYRYQQFTAGRYWTGEYGVATNPDHFKFLSKYSPLHNIQKGEKYPATMVMTGDHDDRVVPGHSFKFVAALQNAQKGKNPVLIHIQTKAGHGAGKPLSKTIEEIADKWTFVLSNMGLAPKK